VSDGREALKGAAAEAAAQLVQDGMAVGLGTGTTVRHLLPAIAARGLHGVRYVATSPATAEQAVGLGLTIEPFDTLDRLDLAIDGADQIAPDGSLVKGGGGAHVREKVVAAAAGRFVVIADATKVVDVLAAPVPLELLAFGLTATLAEVAPAAVRAGASLSPDGNVIADYAGPVDDPAGLAARLDAVPGVVGHGLFAAALVSDVLIGRPGGVEHRAVRGSSQR
jgi:ribose 5-phosphate isomerase A